MYVNYFEVWMIQDGCHQEQYPIQQQLELSEFIIYQLVDKRIAVKGVLKFTLKQLRHVSV